MRTIHGFASNLARASALGLAGLCAVAGLAGQVGRWDDRLDILNHFAPYWLAGAVLAAALWLALGRTGRMTPALAALAAVVWSWVIAPELLAATRAGPAAPNGPAFKVVQFNLWFHNDDPASTIAWLLAQNADVLVLEEARHPLIDVVRRTYPYRVTCAGQRYSPTMIFSRRR